MTAIRCHHPTPLRFRTDPLLAHQLGHPFARTSDPLLTEFAMNPWATLHLAIVRIYLLDTLGERFILHLMLRRQTFAPLVGGAFIHAEHLAHPPYGIFLSVFCKKTKFHGCCRENTRMAFLKYPALVSRLPTPV